MKKVINSSHSIPHPNQIDSSTYSTTPATKLSRDAKLLTEMQPMSPHDHPGPRGSDEHEYPGPITDPSSHLIRLQNISIGKVQPKDLALHGTQVQPEENNLKFNFSPETESLSVAEQNIKDDFAILSLIKMHLSSDSPMTYDELQPAVRLTSFFLEGNGERGNKLVARLKILCEHLHANPEMIPEIHSRGLVATTKRLNNTNIRKHDIDIYQTLGKVNRLDKKHTGLAHTLLQKSGEDTWFELLGKYNLESDHDKKIMTRIHSEFLLPQKKTKICPEVGSQAYKAILGAGVSGKVVLAASIKTGEFVAVKKINNMERAIAEYAATQKLLEPKVITEDLKDLFVLAIAYINTMSSERNKSYIIYPLIGEGTQEDFMSAAHSLKEVNKIVFQKKNFEQIKILCRLVSGLESLNMVHPDLKPANILGERLGDFADLLTEGNIPMSYTTAYTIPGAFDINNDGNKVPKALNDLEFKTFNRFSLGVMLMESILNITPGGLFPDEELHLPLTDCKGSRPYTKGFSPELIEVVPTEFDDPLTLYDQEVLKFAKILMSADRQQALDQDFNKWISRIESLRISE